MIAAGQQFAAAVRSDVVHLAFWSVAEDDWRLACTDELAQLQGQDPILSCATCIEIADEEVAGEPSMLQPGDDIPAFLAKITVWIDDFARVVRPVGTFSSGSYARELSTP